MPDIICSVCNEEFFVKRNGYKLLVLGAHQYCSPECVLKFINGRPKSPVDIGSETKTPYLTRADVWDGVTNEWFRSRYEIYVARFFLLNKIYAAYEVRTIIYKPRNRHSARYTPDFWLPAFDLYVEVKGLWGASAKSKFIEVSRDIGDDRLILLPWHLHNQFKKQYGKIDEHRFKNRTG